MGKYDNTFFQYDIQNCISSIEKVEETCKKQGREIIHSKILLAELTKLWREVKELADKE